MEDIDNMRNEFLRKLYFGLFVLLISINLFPEDLKIQQETTGPIKTNCYLLYDTVSKEAAIIDCGGPVNALIETIEKENLTLKYILITHGHIDHVEGVPELKKQFPEARLCITKPDYDDFLQYQVWCKENAEKSKTAKFMLETPEFKQWFEYDLSDFITPDIFIDDAGEFKLGDKAIRFIYTPGHSRGSISYLVNNNLFSGDLLFIKGSGVIDMLGSSQEDFDKTIKMLLEMLPDETTVYRGHGKSIKFGEGKKENWWVKP